MKNKTLCLAPECYKLWAIRPGLCFLYDKIIIDDRDYYDIVSSKEKSTYNFILAKNVERLRMEGILKLRSYENYLPSMKRKRIHELADSYIETLNDKKRFDLAVYAHTEYKEYLKSQLLFCQTNEPKFKTLTERLVRVEDRITQLHFDGIPTEETDDTLKRITAKSIAGTYIVSEIKNAHLYDSSEYRPFINVLPVNSSRDDDQKILFHEKAEDRAMDIVAALVLNKRFPDVTVYDDHSVTMFLRTRDDMERLRSLIGEVIDRYNMLIKADTQTAYLHLEKEFKKTLLNLDQELTQIAKRTGLIWKITEILASIKFSIIKPFLNPLKHENLEKYRQKELEKLANRDKLLADLIFVFDKVRFGNKRYEISYQKKFPKPKENEIILWGQDGLSLPWYEKQ